MLFPAKVLSPAAAEKPLHTFPSDSFRIHFDGSNEPRFESGSERGKRYALECWEDLRTRDEVPDAPTVLQDSPRFEERGFMLDISRDRVPTMSFLKWLIEKLAQLRYNQLQLYTEHTFAFRHHSTVWKDASPLTPAEIGELDDLCAGHGIDLVPNQNCFGHMERWLKHSTYRPLAECPDGFDHPITGRRNHGSTLYPSPESEAFVREILSEVFPLFRSRKANVGGDEPWELGQGRSREEAAARGKHEVYLSFMEKIFAITEKLGKEPIFWADIVLERPELVSRIPSNAVPAIWGYHPSHPYAEQCRIVAGAGFRQRFQVVPGTNTWNSFTGRLDFALENIRVAAREGAHFGARGLILTCWGDGGHHQSTASLFPPLIHAARACWEGGDEAPIDLASEVDALFFPDTPAGNGRAICELGRIDSLLPFPNHNQSFLHKAFFAPEADLPTLIASTTPETLEEVVDALQGVCTESATPGIRLSQQMSLWAAGRCLAGEHAERVSGVSLHELKENFRRIWLSESRPGGLEDSLARFPADEV